MMKILVVDNDENTVETIKTALMMVKNYNVDAAYGGKEALEKIRKKGQYDVILLDIMMPGVDGIEVCRRLGRDERLKNNDVVLVSALPVNSKEFQESQAKFSELQVVKGVLEKPFNIDDLLEKVAKYARQP